MYHFPNLDETTRLVMIRELDLDLSNGMFYEPVSIQKSFIPTYKQKLKASFEKGNAESLKSSLSMDMFKSKDKNGRKIPKTISEMLSFSDFNRYYIRALIVRAINEEKSLIVYRAKQSANARMESKYAIGKIYSDKVQLQHILEIVRDYRKLFSLNPPLEFLKPNSGLSLKLL